MCVKYMLRAAGKFVLHVQCFILGGQNTAGRLKLLEWRSDHH